MKSKMKVYRYIIKDPKELRLESLAARLKAANDEDDGAFLEYVDKYPTMFKGQLRKENMSTYSLFFESDDMNEQLFKIQLTTFLGTKKIIKSLRKKPKKKVTK